MKKNYDDVKTKRLYRKWKRCHERRKRDEKVLWEMERNKKIIKIAVRNERTKRKIK